MKTIHDTLKNLDNTNNYSVIGGALAFAVTIASMESASQSLEQPLFKTLSPNSEAKCPFPLGNILGGGAHAGPGTPDIQEILICATGSKTGKISFILEIFENQKNPRSSPKFPKQTLITTSVFKKRKTVGFGPPRLGFG